MEDPPQGVYNHEALYYIAKSIDVMGKVDAVYFAYDWATARGCRIERKIAEEYGVKILEYDFLDEIRDEYQSTTRVSYNDYEVSKPRPSFASDCRQLVEKDENGEVKLKWNTTPKLLSDEEIENMTKLNEEIIKGTTFGIPKGEMPY